MKLLMVALLFTLTSCGAKKIADNVGKAIGEGLTCGGSGIITSMFTETVSIDQKHIDLVNSELHGRPFSKSAFWSRLSRETRLSLNLHVNKELRTENEELIYQGVSLFFENLEQNGKESFEINARGKRIVIVNNSDRSVPVRGSCQGSEKDLAAVDTKKVIHESTLQRNLRCEVAGERFDLRIYQGHIVAVVKESIIAFSGAEAIRTENGDDLTVDALNGQGETLKLKLGWSAVEIRLFGKNRSLVGTGICR